MLDSSILNKFVYLRNEEKYGLQTPILFNFKALSIKANLIFISSWEIWLDLRCIFWKCGSLEISLMIDERSSNSILRKRLRLRQVSNPQPSDDRWSALTIELSRLRWWAKVQVRHKRPYDLQRRLERWKTIPVACFMTLEKLQSS